MFRHKVVARLLLAALASIATSTLYAQDPAATPSTRQDAAASLAASADSRRAYAEKMQAQAREWRELEANARQYAKTAVSQQDRDSWLKDAEQRKGQAEKLEADAARELALAGQEAEDKRSLEQQIAAEAQQAAQQQSNDERRAAELVIQQQAAQSTAASSPDKGMTVEAVLGRWEVEGSTDVIEITQQDPASEAYPHRLQARAGTRLWTGHFHPDPAPGSPLVSFRYTPRSDEMNPDIPDWARADVNNQLVWRLEMHWSGKPGQPGLHMEFYPGEVKWDHQHRSKALLAGPGSPRSFTLRREGEAYCGPDVTQAYIAALQRGRDRIKALPSGELGAWDGIWFLSRNGGSIDVRVRPARKPGEEGVVDAEAGGALCPCRSCAKAPNIGGNTLRLCGECLPQHVGNDVMYGFIGTLLGVPNDILVLGGHWAEYSSYNNFDPPQSRAAYAIGRNLANLDSPLVRGGIFNETNVCALFHGAQFSTGNGITQAVSTTSSIEFIKKTYPFLAQCKPCPTDATTPGTLLRDWTTSAWQMGDGSSYAYEQEEKEKE